MRIAHVSSAGLPVFEDGAGAIQRRIAELASAQAARGDEVTVYSPAGSDLRGEREIDGIRVRHLELRSPPPLRVLEFQARVARRIRADAPPEILHFHSQPEGALATAGVPAAKVMSYDNFYFRRAGRGPLHAGYRRALSRFDALLPCSEYCATRSREYWSLDRARMHVFFNGVNVDQFRPDPELGAGERAALGADGKLLLYVGRVCRQKGSDMLLDAFRAVRAARDDVQLALAGPIEQFHGAGKSRSAEWGERMRAAGASYLGKVPDARLAGLYNAADLFVMPTRELEMFGMAAVEAQACGTPVVASDHGGLRETVPEESGARFPPGDADALAGAILALLEDERRLEACGSRALEHARRFAWGPLVSRLGDIYRSVRGEAA